MMNWFWIFTSAFILILLIILFVPLNAFIEYNEKLFIKIKVGFLSFKIGSKKRKNDKKSKGGNKSRGKIKGIFKNKNKVESAKALKNLFIAAGKTVRYLFRKTSVRTFYLSVKVGALDAADAAIKYGQVSSAVYPLCSVINSFASPKSYKVMVLPDFMSEKINIIFKTNIKANLIGMILVMIKFIKSYKIESKK